MIVIGQANARIFFAWQHAKTPVPAMTADTGELVVSGKRYRQVMTLTTAIMPAHS
ncbi:hypothetical protein [Lacticaseibacillus nasuensis]|uniref:hypothetical protein n=1 Tax=Lacticaseibacillus nasuensis TaxID=944671 RepID=UPI001585CF2B|nr:hypothetical protein [Lacticaseibacillus nasuensis]